MVSGKVTAMLAPIENGDGGASLAAMECRQLIDEGESMIDYEGVRAHCLKQKGAVEEFPFGPEARVFKVMGKMFGLMPVGGTETWISLKCDPFLGEVLRENYPAIKPAYHMKPKAPQAAPRRT